MVIRSVAVQRDDPARVGVLGYVAGPAGPEGAPGEDGAPGAPGAPGATTVDGLTDAGDFGRAATKAVTGTDIALGITRLEIATRTLKLRSFIVDGFYVSGDLGAGARYVRGRGLMEIQDGAGTWFKLAPAGQELNGGHFGIVGDGSDETALINAAIAAVPSGGSISFPRPPLYYGISGPIQVGDGHVASGEPGHVDGDIIPSTQQDIGIFGLGSSSGTQEQLSYPYQNVAAVKFVAVSGAPSAMFQFNGPIKVRFSGIACDGNMKADTGLYLMHVFGSQFTNWTTTRVRTGVREDSYSNPIKGGGPDLSVSCGSSDNHVSDFTVETYGYSDGTGVDIGFDTFTGVGLDTNRDIWENGKILVDDYLDSTMIRLRGCDLLTFRNVLGYGAGQRNAKALRIRAPKGAPHLPCEIAFYNCPLIGQFEVEWDQPSGGGAVGTGRAPGHPQWNPDYNGGFGIGWFPLATGDRVDPNYVGHGDLNLSKGHYGFDDRGNLFGPRAQLGNFFGGFRYDAPAVVARLNAPVTVQNTAAEVTTFATAIPGFMLQARPQNLGQFSNDYVWDRRLCIRMSGTFLNNTGANQNAAFRVGFGGSNALSTGAVTLPALAAYRRWVLDLTIVPTGNVYNQFTADAEMRIFDTGSVDGDFVGDLFRTLGRHKTGLAQDLGVTANLFAAITLGAASSVLAMTLDEAVVEIR